MSQTTKIEWTDATATPFPGCKKISPGCDNCYAERMAMRLKAAGLTKYATCVDGNGWTGDVGHNLASLDFGGPPKHIFVQSMGDLFYEGISDDQRDAAFGRMLAQPQHTFQILTKRPERAVDYFDGVRESQAQRGEPSPFPAPNIWLGVTAENQEWADKRIPILLQIPAAVRFVSLEPLLGPIDLFFATGHWENVKPAKHMGSQGTFVYDGEAIHRLDWVIVGCESGPNRRPCDKRWVEDIVAQCHAASIPVFVKQIHISDGRGGTTVIKDANHISNQLGYAVEDIRKFPAGNP